MSELWRAMFLDLADWTQLVARWQPAPARVLELGCGEGYSTERLVATFPGAAIEAIDVAETIGRLYAGPPGRVRFRKMYAEELAKEMPGAFDLIVLSDVLHHVPAGARSSLLAAIRGLMAPGGVLAFKDWHRDTTPMTWMVWGSDRFLTGDRVAYLTRSEARRVLEEAFGAGCITDEAAIAPWSNNYAFRIVPETGTAP
ncbi:class I SAM-dependent methyltransferase [Novosphingobium rosa]|uniref:class I SAM-dependent methyltransferase n=1 Tax=Novosphingobium rosa TaxID=76978 RepID=UPI0014719430|nr:class I SAM-dependent methyltransferase [Novosphingobium rosa]